MGGAVKELDLEQAPLGFLGTGEPVHGDSLKDASEPLLVTSLAEPRVHLGLQVFALGCVRLERFF